MASIYRVVKAHKPDPGEPLVLKAGETVSFERKATPWDGWLWCSKPSGECGWVPESWTRIQGATCVAQRDYTARELTVQPGETLDAILTESGWLLSTSSTGEVGWAPLECVRSDGSGRR